MTEAPAGGSPQTVGERLTELRERRFVGRREELELFGAAIAAERPPFAVLRLHGPGGIGKTALLGRFAAEAEAAGVATARVDLREIDPIPPAFRAALSNALETAPDAIETKLADGAKRVLMIDTYEVAGPLDAWLREVFLPRLGAATLVVIAGRDPPGPEWVADPGWGGLARSVSVRNLAPDQVREYLRAAGVAERLHDQAARLTHGHPLALALLVEVVEQRGGEDPLPASLAEAPDIVRPLQQLFLEGVPSDRHRAALEAAAHVRALDEDLLRVAVGEERAGELFAWLRTLSFVEQGSNGLVLHDLVRDVIDADLRWRDPGRYAGLRARVRDRLVGRIRAREAAARKRAVADLVYLHRSNPLTASFFDWETFGGAYGDVLRPGDAEPILAFTAAHEGDEAAALVAHWLEAQPQGFHVVRATGGEVRGFVLILALHDATPEQIAADPGAASMWEYVQRQGAPRPGDQVYAGRALIDRDHHQAPSPTTGVAAIASTQTWFGADRLAWNLIGAWVDPEPVAPMMAYLDHHRAPEADYEVGGRRYAVFAHDFRRLDLERWLDLAHRRELEHGLSPEAAATGGPDPVVALSHAEFADAVRAALRDLHRDEALARNPLLRSRLARERGGDRPSPAVLRDLLGEAIDALRADPRDEKLHRAVARTYVRPARTQELAAEALGVPFSTYRRHLRRGIERVTEWLWQRELYGPQAG